MGISRGREFKDLVAGLTDFDPLTRLTVDEAFSHGWSTATKDGENNLGDSQMEGNRGAVR